MTEKRELRPRVKGGRKMVGIRVDPHIWQLAGELGIKRYEVCEEALQKAIKKLGAVKRLKK